jgi:hypothetical protein
VPAVSSTLENLALRKQLLIARCGLCRLRIRRELDTMHDKLARPARIMAYASSAALLARLAVMALKLVRRI